ncbi:triple tyrosine motif-containing protein [Psychroserpens sp. AS72]|uniref:helix-turn-helix and ligand-binding sensor domain-containing protein n=1 Tax=Psychroserpens sp. AS72 TaxID=3135775 RepID=UPI003181A77B
MRIAMFSSEIKRLELLVAIICFVITLSIQAQELPPIQNFTSEDYGAQNQNWSISQNLDKYIYIANNLGLLEYNGSKWQLYESPNRTILRSVKAVDNRIYTGCYMEFGYWERNPVGTLEYNSLSQKLNIDLIEDEQIWNIITLDDWIIFQSLKRIYIINSLDLSVNIINSQTELSKMLINNGTIYFQKKGIGLFKILNGKESLVSDHEILKTKRVVNVFQHVDKFLIQTQEQGFFVFTSEDIKQWDIPANEMLFKTSVFNSLQLNDGTFVLGTISSGAILMSSEGKIKYQINQDNGLINNTVLSLFQDVDENVWLGLDNGISFINLTSPYHIFKDDSGNLGTVYTSLTVDDMLYLGTNQGLFYKNRNDSGDFNFMNGTNGQVWVLRQIDDKIFCGHNKGTMIIENNEVVNTITDALGTWDFKRIPNTNNLILQGNYNGFTVLEKINDNWSFRNKIEGIDISVRFFEFFNDKIYVNHELKGLYTLTLGPDFQKVVVNKQMDHIYKGTGSNIINYNGELIYASSEGVFKQNEVSEFVLDTTFTSLFYPFKNKTTLLPINGDKTMLWRFTDDNIAFISSGSLSNSPSLRLFPVSNSIKNVVTGFENLTKISSNEFLIGQSNGYLVFNEDIPLPQKDLEIAINKVEIHKIDEPKIQIDPKVEMTFKNKQNNISFETSFANYGKIVENKYQYQLIGLSDNWSDWTDESSQTFENLPFGSYTFNVRGKVGNNVTNNIASYDFTIKRPLLLSNIAIALYILSLIILLLVIHYYYRRYYRTQQDKVIKNAKRELELQELENSQELMSVRNEQLQQDIDNKNRELAISTMSIIKKNEFLSNIKDELKNANEAKGVAPIIKIIDKNLNNTDDWKLFEEAFNNADKDFLKKVKAKHASLTPNDLRLCAYLRLNLSSKEIAPLLNISPKSVEVKRYRLRKKMELSHETSLTNYILEL